MSGTIICHRGQRQTICDVCDGTQSLAKVMWFAHLIDICERCQRHYGVDAEWRAWADRVIERNLGIQAGAAAKETTP